MDRVIALQLADWTPMRVYWQARRLMVDWCYLGNTRFTDPLFDQTIERRLSHPFSLLFQHQTPIEMLTELQAEQPGLKPTGFIFHMSRCGSTLVAQMLAALPQHIVISEASPIDAVLRSKYRDPSVSDAQLCEWLRAILSAYGRRRDGGEKYFFIKFDSWHTLFLDVIQRAFPGVPWIFLYRDPVEVMVSHQRMMGSQMMPGTLPPELVGLDLATIVQMSLEEYGARVLAKICEAALAHQNANGLLVNYRQLPDAVWTMLQDHFRVEFAESELERMRAVAAHHAKFPQMKFGDDTADKQRTASESVRTIVNEAVMPFYEQLEIARVGANHSALRLMPSNRHNAPNPSPVLMV